MDEDTAEKAKARQHLRILLVCIAVGVMLPFVLYYFVQSRAGR